MWPLISCCSAARRRSSRPSAGAAAGHRGEEGGRRFRPAAGLGQGLAERQLQLVAGGGVFRRRRAFEVERPGVERGRPVEGQGSHRPRRRFGHPKSFPAAVAGFAPVAGDRFGLRTFALFEAFGQLAVQCRPPRRGRPAGPPPRGCGRGRARSRRRRPPAGCGGNAMFRLWSRAPICGSRPQDGWRTRRPGEAGCFRRGMGRVDSLYRDVSAELRLAVYLLLTTGPRRVAVDLTSSWSPSRTFALAVDLERRGVDLADWWLKVFGGVSRGGCRARRIDRA